MITFIINKLGTPVQNNIEELLAMLSFLNPHLFSSRKCEIVMNAFMMQHGNKNTVSSSTSNGLTISQLRSILAPFVSFLLYDCHLSFTFIIT